MKVTLKEACADDLGVVNAARVSFDKESDWVQSEADGFWSLPKLVLPEGDDKLIGFLLKNRHGTPFEHSFFKFHVEAPIFVFREWHRHRIGHSYNEMSARYVEMEEKFYWPDAWRTQHGKPGAYTYEPVSPDWDGQAWADEAMERAYAASWTSYKELLALGVAKEQARAVLPVGIYTQMIWSCNARSLMHFLGLRNAPTAMKEIRDLAGQAEEAMKLHMPVTHAAFVANGRTAP